MDEKIIKLTPELIKRIIAEEKQKLIVLKENKERKKRNVNKIKILKETKRLQRALVRKFKKLYLLRESVKKSLKK